MAAGKKGKLVRNPDGARKKCWNRGKNVMGESCEFGSVGVMEKQCLLSTLREVLETIAEARVVTNSSCFIPFLSIFLLYSGGKNCKFQENIFLNL